MKLILICSLYQSVRNRAQSTHPVPCWKGKQKCLKVDWPLRNAFWLCFSYESSLIHYKKSDFIKENKNILFSSSIKSSPPNQVDQVRRRWFIEASLQKSSRPTFLFLFFTQTSDCLWLWRPESLRSSPQELLFRLKSRGHQ